MNWDHPSLAESRETVPIEFAHMLPSSSDLANVDGRLNAVALLRYCRRLSNAVAVLRYYRRLLKRCSSADVLREAIEAL